MLLLIESGVLVCSRVNNNWPDALSLATEDDLVSPIRGIESVVNVHENTAGESLDLTLTADARAAVIRNVDL